MAQKGGPETCTLSSAGAFKGSFVYFTRIRWKRANRSNQGSERTCIEALASSFIFSPSGCQALAEE